MTLDHHHDSGGKAKIKRHMEEVLAALEGQVVSIANAEAVGGSVMGKYLFSQSVYPAKVLHVSGEILTLGTHFSKHGKGADPEPAKQFVPVARVKRVSVMKDEVIIHL